MATQKKKGSKSDRDGRGLNANASVSQKSSRIPAKAPRSRFTDEYGVMLELLIAARDKADATQTQVAVRIGKTQSHISMCEAKEREFSFVDIFRFCEAIGIEFSDFAKQVEQEIKRRNI